MTSATQARWTFAIPGDPATPTGGYIYDAKVIEASGGTLTPLRLPGGFPYPSGAELAETRGALLDAGPCLIDGLAFGALPVDLITSLPHAPVALCHHPLGLETGLDAMAKADMIAAERAVLHLARHVIVTSNATKRTVMDAFGLSDTSVTVAPPGLDLAPAATGSGSDPVLLTVASLTRRKGHDVLVRALSRLGDQPWRAVWVGPDDRDANHVNALRCQIADAALSDRIEITGGVAEAALQDAYAHADIFVLPSRYEGYGMVFDEAMMRALPIIACAAGAAPDVVPPEAGILVPVDDDKALEDAISGLLANGTTRVAMGSKGRDVALSRPTWADTWTIVQSVLEAHS